jgi:hypothetical protein
VLHLRIRPRATKPLHTPIMNLSDSSAEVGGRVVRHHDRYRVRHGAPGRWLWHQSEHLPRVLPLPGPDHEYRADRRRCLLEGGSHFGRAARYAIERRTRDRDVRPDTRVLDIPNPGTPEVHLLDVAAWSAAERDLRAAARSIKPTARSRPSSRSCGWLSLASGRAACRQWELISNSYTRGGPHRPHPFSPSRNAIAAHRWTIVGATSVWSSKEALAKAFDTPIDYDPRRLEGPAFWPNGAAGRWRAYGSRRRRHTRLGRAGKTATRW